MGDQITDISAYVQAKSDQINAADLVGGPITARIRAVVDDGAGTARVWLDGHDRYWRASKGMLRVMADLWGGNPTAWIGQWVRLYREPTIEYGGEPLGGVRLCGVSGIDRPRTAAVTEKRGKKKVYKLDPITPPAPASDLPEPTVEQLEAWRAAKGRGPWADLTEDEQAKLMAWLRADPRRMREVVG